MGSYVEMHANKRKGSMDISDVGKETLIHGNGPPLARANSLGEAALDRYFDGRHRFLLCCIFPPFFILWVALCHIGKQLGLHSDKKAQGGGASLPIFLIICCLQCLKFM